MAQILHNVGIGGIVKIKENGTLVDFLIMKHGYPDDGNNKTLVLRKDIVTLLSWDDAPSPSKNDYLTCSLANWLDNQYRNRIDEAIRHQIMEVKIPCTTGLSSDPVNYSSRKIFLLSTAELNYDGKYLKDGKPLPYFTTNDRARAYYNGADTRWWTRTGGYLQVAKGVKVQNDAVYYMGIDVHSAEGVRPAFTLPSSIFVTDTGEVTTNQPPSTPPSITVSEPVKGGKPVTVSWGASTDADGNLSGYRLERSVNNAAFQQIHDGNTLTFSDNITYGWQTVAYRVRAYDSAGAVSGYTTSRAYTVINNSAPTTPPWLNIPAEIKGGKPFEISWGASTDVDGNLAGYQLERSLNGGAFGQIYTGANQKYTDTVAKGTNTAAYRVRAYDTENAQSGYAVSDTRTIINNTPPSISGEDSQLGTKNEPFSISYSVSDPDGDAITVTEKLDNQVLRTFTAEAGKEYQVTLDADRFLQILNGSHTLTVTATDAPGESAVRTWTWIKNITHISIVKKVPKEPADGECPYKCLLNLNSVIPTGALVTVEVCNNGFDQQPTWEECTAGARAGDAIFFSNRTKTAEKWGVNFRVTISRSGAPGDCYVTGVSGNFEEERNA